MRSWRGRVLALPFRSPFPKRRFLLRRTTIERIQGIGAGDVKWVWDVDLVMEIFSYVSEVDESRYVKARKLGRVADPGEHK